MLSKPRCYATLLMFFMLNSTWASEVCVDDAEEVSALAQAVKTIYPNVESRSLHYLYKNYVSNHKSCREDEVWVQGPLFSEGGYTSEGDESDVIGSKSEKLGNSFCMNRALFEYERGLGRSVFQTRVSSGSKNEGTSFLVADNIIMTNHHIAAPGPDGQDCKNLEISLNKEKEEWISCKKVLFCDKERDVCFVEMNQASPGIEIGNLVPRVKLNCEPVKKQTGMLIGNSNKFGIQGSAGPIQAESNGKIQHHIPMVGGASGSPIMSSKGEVIGINYGHNGAAGNIKDYVSMNEKTDMNVATSMPWVRREISRLLKEQQYNFAKSLMGKTQRENLLKIDKALKQNPTCLDWYL